MSSERILAAIFAMDEPFKLGLANMPNAKEVLREALGKNELDPNTAYLVDIIQKIVSAYMGETNLDMAVTARELLNLVANGGRKKGKEFTMFVVDGPGEGDWRCFVEPIDLAPKEPIIVLPSVLRLPVQPKPRIVKP